MRFARGQDFQRRLNALKLDETELSPGQQEFLVDVLAQGPARYDIEDIFAPNQAALDQRLLRTDSYDFRPGGAGIDFEDIDISQTDPTNFKISDIRLPDELEYLQDFHTPGDRLKLFNEGVMAGQKF